MTNLVLRAGTNFVIFLHIQCRGDISNPTRLPVSSESSYGLLAFPAKYDYVYETVEPNIITVWVLGPSGALRKDDGESFLCWPNDPSEVGKYMDFFLCNLATWLEEVFNMINYT